MPMLYANEFCVLRNAEHMQVSDARLLSCGVSIFCGRSQSCSLPVLGAVVFRGNAGTPAPLWVFHCPDRVALREGGCCHWQFLGFGSCDRDRASSILVPYVTLQRMP